jgi:hypothetical protein
MSPPRIRLAFKNLKGNKLPEARQNRIRAQLKNINTIPVWEMAVFATKG